MAVESSIEQDERGISRWKFHFPLASKLAFWRLFLNPIYERQPRIYSLPLVTFLMRLVHANHVQLIDRI